MRTSCEQTRERLSLQLDDELSAHETLLLERHLGRCSACTAFASGVRASTALLRSTQLEPAPPSWLVRRPAATRFSARAAAVTGAVAAAVLVGVSTFSLMGNSGRTAAGVVGLWPTGLAVHPAGDQNLGVQHVAFEKRAPDGPQRGSSPGLSLGLTS